MAKVPNAVEILRKIWTAWVGCTSVTDRRQTDRRATAYSERERVFTFAKNRELCAVKIQITQNHLTSFTLAAFLHGDLHLAPLLGCNANYGNRFSALVYILTTPRVPGKLPGRVPG